MGWDLWGEEPSLKQLDPHTLAHITVHNISERKFPLNKWRTEENPIPEYADAFVELCVVFYQLSIFLDFLERKFGSDLSDVVRSHIIALMSKGKYAAYAEKYFDAVQTGRALPEREERLADEPLLQTDSNVAKSFLSSVAEPEEEKTNLYPILGLSLSRGRVIAESAFGGFVEQIEFQPETILGLSKPEDSSPAWSKPCGAFERQLQRRHNNPLFPPEKRCVITAELLWARSQDNYDVLELQEGMRGLLKHILDAAEPMAPFGDVLKKRDQVEQLIIRAAGIGDLANSERQKLLRLYDTIVGCLRNACSGEIRAKLESALAGSEGILKSAANNFVAQMNRANSPISTEDVLPSLLVEDVETVRVVAGCVSPEARIGMVMSAAALVENARKEGYVVSDAEEKLRAFDLASTRSWGEG